MSMYAHAGKHVMHWHGMHHACTCEKNPDKLGGESHRFHVHAKSMRACVDMHERPKSLDGHVKKKTMLEITPTHAN